MNIDLKNLIKKYFDSEEVKSLYDESDEAYKDIEDKISFSLQLQLEHLRDLLTIKIFVNL